MSSLTKEILHTAVLPVPSPRYLQPGQIRGTACVWGGEPLDDDSAIELGWRVAGFRGVGGPWLPRACTSCVGDAARRALPDHVRERWRCDGQVCDICHALRRIAEVCS